LLAKNAESHLKAPAEMARLFADYPHAIEETQHFLRGITFSLDELSYHYPEMVTARLARPSGMGSGEKSASARHPAKTIGQTGPGIIADPEA